MRASTATTTSTADPETLVEFVTVSSALCPELQVYYERDARE